MGCCGQKRAVLTSAQAVRVSGRKPAQPLAHDRGLPTGAPQTAIPKDPGNSAPGSYSVLLRYTEISPVLVRGPISGRHYRFSRSEPVQTVDTRDAAALLRTGFFRQN